MALEIPLEGEDAKPGSIFSQIREKAASRQLLPISTTAPTVATLDKGVFELAYISGTLRLYTRKDDSMYYLNFTAV